MKQITVVAHNLRFHSDDAFAVATLILALGEKNKIKIVRTRDMEIIEKADYVVDVGAIHDEKINRFDHHQKGGAGMRANGVSYASFGLVWKKFGPKLGGSQEVFEMIDEKLCQPIDGNDNGMDLFTPLHPGVFPYLFQDMAFAMGPTWKEDESMLDKQFLKLVDIAGIVLSREIVHAKDLIEAKGKVDAIYKSTKDKRIIIMDENYPYSEILSAYPEPMLAVRPDPLHNWRVNLVPTDPHSYQNYRIHLPQKWAGKRDEDMAKASGVPDATFCHNGRFMAVAKTKEGAVKLAHLALEANEK